LKEVSMTFNQINNEDAHQLKDFVYLAIHVNDHTERPDRSVLEVPQIMKYYEGWGRQGDFGLKAVNEDDDMIIGMIWIRLFESEDPSYGFISDEIPEITMSIRPEYRGQGVGTQLMTKLIENVKTQFNALSLSVSFDNPAKRLYEKFGFVKYEKVGDSITMCLDLDYWNGATSW